MSSPRRLAGFVAAAGSALLPTAAFAQESRLTVAQVFFNATPVVKVIMAGLLLAAAAAIVVAAAKLASGRRLSGGSAYLSALRWGAPLLGFLGASYAALAMFLGIANVGMSPSLAVLAPGFAEIAMLLGLGFLSGAVAVVFNWAVEARIDRQVLS